MEYCSPQNMKGSDVAPLKVKKSPINITNKGYKTTSVAWVMPDQHEEVQENAGKPDSAYINKK